MFFGKSSPTRLKRSHHLAARRSAFRNELYRYVLRPQFESLEDRRLLAVVNWDGGAGTFNWTDANNWDNNLVPTSVDDVVISDLVGTPTILIPISSSATAKTVTSAEKVSVLGDAGLPSELRIFGAATSTFSMGLDLPFESTLRADVGNVQITGSSDWAFAQLLGTGSVFASGTITISGSVMVATNLVNSGSIEIGINAGATFDGVLTNQSAGIVTLNGNSAIAGSGGISNLGLLHKIGIGTTSSISNAINNVGIIRVSDGSLVINGVVSQDGGATLTGGTWLADGGNINFPIGTNFTTIGSDANVVLLGLGAINRIGADLNVIAGDFSLSGGYLFSTASHLDNSGTVNIDIGSSLLTTGTYTQTSGTTTVNGLLRSTTTISVVINGGTLAGSGTIDANVSFGAGGVLTPGSSPGILTINRNLTLGPGSTTRIEVGGTNPATPDFDQILVNGSATLGGALQVTLINGFIPDASESFRWLTFASSSGAFATYDLPKWNDWFLLEPSVGATFNDLVGTSILTTNTLDSGSRSLRDSITRANASPGPDVLLFNIPGAGPHTISPLTELPFISDTVIIDATSQPGYPGTPLIELSGSNIAALTASLYVNTSDTTLKGFAIINWTFAGIVFNGDNNKLQSSYLGVRADGTTAGPNASGGIWIYVGDNNTIGTDGDGLNDAAEGNVISANNSVGVYLQAGSENNVIAGNIIGLNAAGTAALGVQQYGIWMFDDAVDGTIIGTNGDLTSDALERNVISGNTEIGIRIDGADNSIIAGNLFGTDAAGTAVIANGQSGISLGAGTDRTRIGTDSDGDSDALERNVIVGGTGNLSGNNFGIALSGTGVTLNTISGNYIGVGADGSTVMANQTGILVVGGANTNTIGGTVNSAKNVISGSTQFGISIEGSGTNSNSVYGNYIGTDSSGLLARPNVFDGIQIDNGAKSNTIGGPTTAHRNLISGNTLSGVLIAGDGTDDTIVASNWIGLKSDGAQLGNGNTGILVTNGAKNAIVDGNVISGNTNEGVRIENFTPGLFTTGTRVQGNFIGTNPVGTGAIPNAVGVVIAGGASSNTVGGTTPLARNVISGNGIGVTLTGSNTTLNSVLGNYIGLGSDGDTVVANNLGIRVLINASGNTLGGPLAGAGNVISGNITHGIVLTSGANTTIVQGNLIGTDASGLLNRGNGSIGINVGSTANVIGGVNAARNIISGNATGVSLGSGSSQLRGNYIGTDITGNNAIGNTVAGIGLNSSGNIVGGLALGEGNVISGNGTGISNLNPGVSTNAILGNIIGLNASGNAALGNQNDGIELTAATFTLIAGNTISSNNTLSGVNGRGIRLSSAASNTTIRGNLIGTDILGSMDLGNLGSGIVVQSANNTIGGISVGARNVISGNAVRGIEITGAGASNNVLQANYIGTNAAGSAQIANDSFGVYIVSGATGNTVGGSTAARNIISGNNNGVVVASGAVNTKIQGNYIGLDASGLFALGNGTGTGVSLLAVSGVIVGVDGNGINDAGEGNVISGNFNNISIQNTVGARISGNIIGLDRNGNNAIPTGNTGIRIFTATNTLIGTDGNGVSDQLERNIISGGRGIYFNDNAIGTRIAGNYIGTDITGTLARGNLAGILTVSPAVPIGTIIGTNSDGNGDDIEGNVISGNSTGIAFSGADWIIAGNVIGLDSTRTAALPNAVGVSIDALSTNTTIGGFTTTPGTAAGNVISGNTTVGILDSLGASGTVIRGNLIGLGADGVTDLGNGTSGIQVNGLSTVIGGDDDDDGALDFIVKSRNVISGNTNLGINIGHSGSVRNTLVQGNYIGIDRSGNTGVANSNGGINIGSAPGTRIGGITAGAGNVISGNAASGISINGISYREIEGLYNAAIEGNIVGLNALGNAAIPNSIGISVTTTGPTNAGNRIGGSTPTARNIISGNSSQGILVSGANAIGNAILGNYIGTDISGAVDIGNASRGVELASGAASTRIEGNTISGNNGGGVLLAGATTQLNVIAGNKLGTNVGGNAAIANGTSGNARYAIELDAASGNIIGGLLVTDRNLISGNIGDGVRLTNGASNNFIQGNWFGVDALGLSAIPNTLHAVHMTGATTWNNSIGGLTSAHGNLLAYSGGSALRLEDITSTSSFGNTFENNVYRENRGLAIDIGAAGPTLNDGLDSGFNLRDFPVLQEVLIDQSDLNDPRLILKGFAEPGRRLQFFVSSPTSNGRGQGADLITTKIEDFFGGATGPDDDLDFSTGTYGAPHAAGSLTANRFWFNIPLPAGVRFGTLITSLALGSISEFGNVAPAGLADADVANNLAPVVSLSASVALTTGGQLQLQGSFVDYDSTDWTALVDYGDGSGVQPLSIDKVSRTFTLQHTYHTSQVAPYQVTVNVLDNGGKIGMGSMQVSVQNEAPVVTYNNFSITSLVNEGGLVTLTGTFSDSGFSDQHVVTINWGDGNVVASNVANVDLPPIPVGARLFTATHRYVDDGFNNTSRDSYRVEVDVTDGSGSDASPPGLFLIEVFNVRPSNIIATLPAAVAENQLLTLNGSFQDPGLADAHTVTVNWGDGTSNTLPLAAVLGQSLTRSFSLTHNYNDNYTSPATSYEVTIEVTDDDEPLTPTVLKKSITVNNVAPSVPTIVLSNALINENDSITLGASFNDPGSQDSHQVVIDWGDGSEETVIDLAPSVLSVSGISHRYRNDPSGANAAFNIVVKVADKDMPAGVYTTATTPIAVLNVAPVLNSPIQLYTRNPLTRQWVEFTGLGMPQINEGDSIRITGGYSDVGPDDLHVINVRWSSSPGHITTAIVNPATRTFEAVFLYTDDYALTTPFDVETISVTVDDQDGGVSAPVTRALQVNNVVPTASYLPGVVDSATPQLIPLRGSSFDPGIDDTLTYSWEAAVAGATIQTQSGASANFVLDRTGYLTSTIVVRLTVSDDDGGSSVFQSALKIGTNASETISVTAADFPSGVNTVMVLALDGEDLIDATQVLDATKRVILDGGKGKDYLFGGAGEDTYILRDGDDSANFGSGTTVLINGVPTALPAANLGSGDHYLLKPNSTLTVLDNIGDNTLDFSLADFGNNEGIRFDLSKTTVGLVAQDVALSGIPNTHIVQALGNFPMLIGSTYGDRLTGADGATVDGGSGADRLFAPQVSTTFTRFKGGADNDILFVDAGSSVSEISFEGDVGADEFTVEGAVTLMLEFFGGADVDILTIGFDATVTEISFEGDTGADIFTVEGSVSQIDFFGGADVDILTIGLDATVNEISFEGDTGADVFTVEGDVLTMIEFFGGADVDILTIGFDATVNEISFEGDMGADEFYIYSDNPTSTIEFLGGADNDILFIGEGSTISEISYEGDLGADIFTVAGDVLTMIEFFGGADVDVLTIGGAASVNQISFEGDSGADELVVFGEVSTIEFFGGADADILFVGEGSTISEISFEGDMGRDRWIILGQLAGVPVSNSNPVIPSVAGPNNHYPYYFKGGEDADVLTLGADASVSYIDFEGDAGADIFTIDGDVLSGIEFLGGADADILFVGADSTINEISFEGDTGADLFVVEGSITTTLDFFGGADIDILFVGEGASISEISFEGDTGADELTVNGGVTQIEFLGGADSDLLTVGSEASISEISFEGDTGADELLVLGGGITMIEFLGGADDDLLFIGAGSSVSEISFEGDDGADVLLTDGSISMIEFFGGADGDRFRNLASGVTSITFWGFDSNSTNTLNDGDDQFLNRGSRIGSLRFVGDSGADIFHSYGNEISEISFEGDSGADVLVVYGSEISRIEFFGGADADVLTVAGTQIGEISFEGDDGGSGDASDTFINRATGRATTSTALSTVFFRGLGGVDAFRNDGNGWDNIVFLGGAGADAFQNNASAQSNIRFEGDAGADVFENNGFEVSSIVFSGGADADVLINDGDGVSQIVFFGGADNDVLLNTGDSVSEISFEGDLGADIFTNLGESVSEISFEGDIGDDRFNNYGQKLTSARFWGGAGQDWFINRSSGVGSSDLFFYSDGPATRLVVVPPVLIPAMQLPGQPRVYEFLQIPIYDGTSADDSADLFVNLAGEVTGIYFAGGADNDIFQNEGYSTSEISFEGDAGNDTALNLASGLRRFTMLGGAGNDTFENRGAMAQDLKLDGGDGNDSLYQRGDGVTASLNPAAVTLVGGAGDDVLAVLGRNVHSLYFDGGSQNDKLLNNSDGVTLIEFFGGLGNDALQNNGRNIGEIRMQGNDGEDSLFNNGSSIGLIDFDGGAGADSLINVGHAIGDAVAPLTTATGIRFLGGDGSDLLRASGANIVRVVFDSGLGDDSLLYNASGTRVDFMAGPGSDVFSYRGSAAQVEFAGEAGNDRVVYAGYAPNVATSVTLDGGDGDDRYEFSGAPQGYTRIVDNFSGATDTSQDTIDFSAFTSGDVTLDLASLAPQPQPGNLTIQLASPMGIERLLGGPGGDVLSGNDRDNYIGGAQYFYGPLPAPVPQNRATQWGYLNFDEFTEASLGEHVYTPAERDEIQRRIEATYYGYDELNQPRTFSDPDRWFNVRFTQNLMELSDAGVSEYVTIRFNETPSYGRPGGESSEIDLGNASYTGAATVQINGLLGGILAPEVASDEPVSSTDPSGKNVEQANGQDLPPATSENFVALSAKIAAHEFAHLLGLRHYDAFGPIGFGVHAPPGATDFKPQYQGNSAAFETFDHIIGSPASVGTTRTNDLGTLFFGEREAVKIASSMSNPADVAFSESSLLVILGPILGTTARQLELATVSVPNTVAKGINQSKTFYVQTASVTGTIGLVDGISQSDYYTFNGAAGDLITVEIASQSMRRFTNNGTNGYIDSIVRLYNASGQLVQTFGADAVNDDEFESSDSLLMDVTLPASGAYTIEVDTFFRGPSDANYAAMIARIAELESIELTQTLTQPEQDLLDRLRDTRDNTDTGSYQLFIYNFAKANRVDGIDTLLGRGGVDILDAGPGQDYALQLGALPAGATMTVGVPYTATVPFTNPGAESWQAVVDYGDSSAPVTYTGITPANGISLSHVYASQPASIITITLSNDDGVSVRGSFTINANNVAPTFEAGPDATLLASMAGAFMRSGITITDPNADVWTGSVNYGDSTASVPLVINQTTKTFNLNHTFTVAGSFTVTVTVSDGVASNTDSFLVTVPLNSPPVAVNDSAFADEAGGVNNTTPGSNPAGNVLANDNDPDAGDTRAVLGIAAGTVATTTGNVGTNVSGDYGTLTVAINGAFAYSLNNTHADVQALRFASDTLTDVFSYTIGDAGGLTSTAQIAITIRGANDSATIAGISTGSVTEDAPINQVFNTLTVSDPDAGQAKFAVPTSLNGTYGSFGFNATMGVWTYTLDNSRAATNALVAGQVVSDSLTVQSLDLTASRTIVITITGASEVPVGSSIHLLNSTACGALTLSGNAKITIQGPVQVNSNCASSAINASGNAQISAGQVRVKGGVQKTGNAQISPAPHIGSEVIVDPYAALAAPVGSSATTQIACSGNSNKTVNPGSYTKITASGNCNLTFQPGVYIIDGGGISVSGNARVSGNGVLFYNAGSNFPNPGGSFGSISLSGNGSFNLSPATTGSYVGVTFFQARDNTAAVTLSGNASGMTGTFYAPKALMTLSGNGKLNMSIIVDRLTVSGNASSALTLGASDPDLAITTQPLPGQLDSRTLRIAIDDQQARASSEQMDRIRTAIQTVNADFGMFGVNLVEVSTANGQVADISLQLSDTSPCGGMEDGILGCSSVWGEIILVQGWTWYTGADPQGIAADQFDFQTIVTHELGHTIGLGHSRDAHSTMVARLNSGIARRDFTQHDLALLTESSHVHADDSEELGHLDYEAVAVEHTLIQTAFDNWAPNVYLPPERINYLDRRHATTFNLEGMPLKSGIAKPVWTRVQKPDDSIGPSIHHEHVLDEPKSIPSKAGAIVATMTPVEAVDAFFEKFD